MYKFLNYLISQYLNHVQMRGYLKGYFCAGFLKIFRILFCENVTKKSTCRGSDGGGARNVNYEIRTKAHCSKPKDAITDKNS